jgi:methionyl aminopeptidase
MAKTQRDQAIRIKTADEIAKMRVAGKLAAEVLDMIGPYVKPGVTTDELDRICHDYIVNVQQAIPAPLGYGEPPFPKSICTSVNHQICHGIPSDKKLKEGDVLNIDITVIKDGYHGDTSKMFFVGEPSIAGKRLSLITQQCMYLGILQVRPGAPLGNIGKAIERHAHANRFSVVEEFCGHGVGSLFHESPQVLHYYSKDSDKIIMQPGMIFTIEPMINQGKRLLKILPDQWTAVTKDHKLSAQWEHTILVTDDSFEILTLREEEAHWRSTL